jgi:hypothetical protein
MTFRSTFSSSSYNGYQAAGNFWYPLVDFLDGSQQVAVSANGNYIVGSNGNVYYYDGSSWSTQTIGYSGYSVAINDDGDTVAIGNYSGSNVYIATRSGTTWSLEATLTGTGIPGNNQGFGRSVSLDGSGDYLIVGASDVDSSPYTNNGAAYFFTRSGTVWTQQSKFISPLPENNGLFGISVAISNDSNYIAVGAQDEDFGTGGVINNGRVHTYTRSGTTLTLRNNITPTNARGTELAEVGRAITLDDNGDLAFTNYNWSDVGGIWYFSRVSNSWSETQFLDLRGYTTSASPTGEGCIKCNGAGDITVLGISEIDRALITTKETTYQQFQLLQQPTTPAVGQTFGYGVGIARNANIIAVTSPGVAGSRIYVYTKQS